MRDYAKISTTLWWSRRFRSLPDDRHRLFYFYLHTCPHVNSVGCYVLPSGYAQADLGWSGKAIREAIDSLSKACLIAFDSQESLVRILGYLRHDPFTNPKHASGAIRIALNLPDCVQKMELFKELSEDRFARQDKRVAETIDRLSKGYRNPSPSPSPSPFPLPYPEPYPLPREEGKKEKQAKEKDAPRTKPSAQELNCVFAHWQNTMGHEKAKLDEQRKRLIRQALALGYSVEDLCQAITGYSRSPFHTGHNDNGRRYDGLELILRNAEKIDAGIEFFRHPPKLKGKQSRVEAINRQEMAAFLSGEDPFEGGEVIEGETISRRGKR